jgi:methanogenic corrinoid protein MtbC1
LAERQEDGLSIRRAVAFWRQLEAEGADPLRASPLASRESTISVTHLTGGDTITSFRQAWLAACMAFNETQAEQILNQAFALYSPETVCLELLQNVVVEVGQLWYRNEASVQQEHFTSALAQRRIESLVAAVPPPTRPGLILVGCPPEEEHSFVSLLFTWLLRRRGWRVIYLGATVPLARMEATLAAAKPQLVVMSAQQLYAAASLLEMACLLQQEKIPCAFGGGIFDRLPDLKKRIPGLFLGKDLIKAVQTVKEIINSPPPPSPYKPASEVYKQALSHYRQRQALIEAYIWEKASAYQIDTSYLAQATQEVARNIIASLTLGDINFLDTMLIWVEGLLINYQLPKEQLDNFLKLYHEAALAHLEDQGQPVLDWLAKWNGNE